MEINNVGIVYGRKICSFGRLFRIRYVRKTCKFHGARMIARRIGHLLILLKMVCTDVLDSTPAAASNALFKRSSSSHVNSHQLLCRLPTCICKATSTHGAIDIQGIDNGHITHSKKEFLLVSIPKRKIAFFLFSFEYFWRTTTATKIIESNMRSLRVSCLAYTRDIYTSCHSWLAFCSHHGKKEK